MRTSRERILTTHVGSLVRPAALAGADADLDEAALEAEVRDVVRRQVETGIDVVNDGEYTKSGWAVYALDRLSGFEVRRDRPSGLAFLGSDLERFAGFFADDLPEVLERRATEFCVGPIRYRGREALERALRLLAAAAAETQPAEVFMTAVAPASTAYNGVDEHYRDEHDYVFAIADALREEYAAIHAAGFVLQVDDAVLANMYDALCAESPERYEEWARLRVDALNHALEGIPAERIRYHICFGSWHVPHVADAPLEDIVDLILSVNAGAYSIEAANPRHEHEWRVWQNARLPDDKLLIPGVVGHHTTTVEHPRLVADRIVRFAKLVGRERVIAGTDCGFAQSRDVRRVHPEIMWAKLESLVAGARLASAELWP